MLLPALSWQGQGQGPADELLQQRQSKLRSPSRYAPRITRRFTWQNPDIEQDVHSAAMNSSGSWIVNLIDYYSKATNLFALSGYRSTKAAPINPPPAGYNANNGRYLLHLMVSVLGRTRRSRQPRLRRQLRLQRLGIFTSNSPTAECGGWKTCNSRWQRRLDRLFLQRLIRPGRLPDPDVFRRKLGGLPGHLETQSCGCQSPRHRRDHSGWRRKQYEAHHQSPPRIQRGRQGSRQCPRTIDFATPAPPSPWVLSDWPMPRARRCAACVLLACRWNPTSNSRRKTCHRPLQVRTISGHRGWVAVNQARTTSPPLIVGWPSAL